MFMNMQGDRTSSLFINMVASNDSNNESTERKGKTEIKLYTWKDKLHCFIDSTSQLLVGWKKSWKWPLSPTLKYNHAHLLYIFGPFWRVAHGHEYAVRQNCAHDQHAE